MTLAPSLYLAYMSLSLPIMLSKSNTSSLFLLRQQITITAGLTAETGWAHVNIIVQSFQHCRLFDSNMSVAYIQGHFDVLNFPFLDFKFSLVLSI